jgi:hypothetical protein
MEQFKKYNQSVIDKCPKDKLLVFDPKDGYEPLCKFLEVELPNEPYPWVNDTPSFKKHTKYTNMFGYFLLGITTIVISVPAYFLIKKVIK